MYVLNYVGTRLRSLLSHSSVLPILYREKSLRLCIQLRLVLKVHYKLVNKFTLYRDQNYCQVFSHSVVHKAHCGLTQSQWFEYLSGWVVDNNLDIWVDNGSMSILDPKELHYLLASKIHITPALNLFSMEVMIARAS